MGPSWITFLWLWPATDHEPHCRHVSIDKIWRRTESTPRSGWWRSHMAGIYSDCSTRKMKWSTILACDTRTDGWINTTQSDMVKLKRYIIWTHKIIQLNWWQWYHIISWYDIPQQASASKYVSSKPQLLLWFLEMVKTDEYYLKCLPVWVKQSIHLTFDHNVGKCKPIIKILTLSDSWENSLCNYYRVFHLFYLTLTMWLHYLAKFKKI